MATAYVIVGDDYIRRGLPPELPELTFTVGAEVRADPYTSSGTRLRFGGFDPGTHELILHGEDWSETETPFIRVASTELGGCRGMVRVNRYGEVSVVAGRRLMVLDFDNPGDCTPSQAGSPHPWTDACACWYLNRADVTDEITGADAAAIVLASLS